MASDLERHRRRQGLILALLLIGPPPIAVLLFAIGPSPVGLTVVLTATAMLVGATLELYRRQRRDAPRCGLPLLPKAQVAALLAVVAGIAGATFLLPSRATAPVGLACLAVVLTVAYVFGARLRARLSDPDERSAVLILGLMAALIALGNSCL